MQHSVFQNGVDIVMPGGRALCRRSPATDLQTLAAVELVRLCLSSQAETAWCEFVRRFQPLIAAVIVKTLRRWTQPQASLIDDLVQETYLKLCASKFKALREFNFVHDKALFGYLRVVASNVVQDHFRNRYCQKRGSGKVEENSELLTSGIPSGEDFAEKAHQTLLVGRIRNCLKTQSSDPHFSRNWTIFWLYFEKGYTAKAISRFPGVELTEKGVESALQRLKEVLKMKLRPQSPRPATEMRACL